MSSYTFIGLIFLSATIFQFGHAFPSPGISRINNDDSQREEILDSNGKYKLIWNKDFDTQTITFQVIVETLGFIGFGISPNGGMAGADIVIGGVLPDGTAYFADRYATGTSLPEIDPRQDWNLLEHSESATHTSLTFSRLFDTCDELDYAIGNDTSNLIWSYGESDTIGYHSTNRGSFSVNLLDPAMPPFDESAVSAWTMSVDFAMPSEETTYWCTIHKSPPLTVKNHIIGFEPYFPTETARTYTHHTIVHECQHPTGGDLGPILDPLMAGEGGHCYRSGEMNQIGLRHCRTYLFVWAVGGRRTIFPDHVGFPIGEDAPKQSYYMLEIHYNNPEKLTLPKFETGLKMFHTTELREFEAGTLTMGHDISITQFLPPRVQSFMTVGHCSPECTTAAIQTDGINAFNVLLHSHLAGRKLKIRQFRDGVELPWMSVDDNYNFDFQQNRPLNKEVKILPGDQFAYECIYDTTSRDVVTIGGFASEEEMCQTFIAYYPKMPTRMCGSTSNIDDFLPYFGIERIRQENGDPDPIVTAPAHLAGQRFTAIANNMTWTDERVADVQKMLTENKHEGICSGSASSPHEVGYLDVVEEYIPEDRCNIPPTDPREEILDPNGKYRLIWTKDFDTQTIRFQVIVETLGFVGFGISPNGGMAGADIVIGGVFPNGTAYFADRYATGTSLPEIDPSQDWDLLEHSENGTHTTLTFSRLFDTCDELDYAIGNDTSNLIWSYGETDTIGYHSTNRGSFSVNLLDPAMPPFDESTVSTWTMASDYQMPAADTTYWCTIHKSPPMTAKNHIIGVMLPSIEFEPHLPSEAARTHTHHTIIHECHHPTGGDLGPILDPLMAGEGGHCYRAGEMNDIGLQYCQTYLFVWAVGGRRTIFPEHVGFPVGENAPKQNYYMLEIHYNNPGELTLPKFVTGINMFHTTELRQHDAGTLTMGHDINISHFLPPKVQSFLTVGHCSSACTAEVVQSDGINVFNVLLHSHLVGRKLKIRQFRDGAELPWMAVDDNYNFDYQQNRPLKDEAKIMPGDQFAYECTYDTSSRDVVTIGGFASEEEMCQTFLAYYPKMPTRMCGSFYYREDFISYFGIESLQSSPGDPDPIVTAPAHLAGQRFTAVANNITWTDEKVAEIQKMLVENKHLDICSESTQPLREVGYLDVPEMYIPADPCNPQTPPPTGNPTVDPTPGPTANPTPDPTPPPTPTDPREEILDPNGKYILIWTKDFDTQTIRFQVIVETLGFIGFGISPNGGMAGADIVIGGVFPNGTAYFADRYATGTSLPEIDPSQDWDLLEHSENATHTTLTFSRLFDTCDELDYAIGNDTSNLIWSFGETDTIGYHSTNRGSFSVNLLDPAMPPFDESTVSTWTMSSDYPMPAADTTYWCTIHKSPPMTDKNHIIGFEAYLPSEAARTHTHHTIIHECHHPTGGDLGPILDPLMAGEGGHCYRAGEMSDIGLQYCRTYLFVWAVGGRRTIFPEHVGFPVGENAPTQNYYMLEIHYNNPGELTLPKFETGINMFHTTDLRQYDAGTLTMGHDIFISHFLPPKVQSFLTVGHCSSACTAEAVQPDGINVFNVLLHSHLAGRKLKIRQFREGVELPWMAVDDNYNFDYQQNRPLKDEAKIMPGDQFAYECTYDTSSREVVTIGGFASEEEMCQTFLAYYPKMPTRMCGSFYYGEDFLPYFGIEDMQSSPGEPDPIVTAPAHLAGQRFTAVANNITWTDEKVAEIQKMLVENKHVDICSESTQPLREVGYLDVPEIYVPADPCNPQTPPPTGNPTVDPTSGPTANPTDNTTPRPTANPTDNPTARPTANPTDNPTPPPTADPTVDPTPGPTANPTDNPTPEPTANPTPEPSTTPSSSATKLMQYSTQIILVNLSIALFSVITNL